MMNMTQKLVSLICLLVLLAGCASVTPTAAPTPTTAAVPLPSPTAAQPTAAPTLPAASLSYALANVSRAGMAAAAPVAVSVKPAVKPYASDPQRAANADLLKRLTAEQVAALSQNGFVVVPGDAAQFYDVYKRATEQGEPVFVSSDALLHTFHILYDYLLRQIEVDKLAQDLQQINQAMLAASAEQYARGSGEVKEAARRNLAFFAVADSLLSGQTKAPGEVGAVVRAELFRIEAHAGLTESPLFGYQEDYSQYVPRGHYTRNETLRRYFKAMMWYGRMMFRLRPGDRPEQLAAGQRETRQAILIVAALQNARAGNEPALRAWERIYEPTAFFVGASDDLTLYDYAGLAREVYGATLALSDLNDGARLDDFIARAMKLRPPRIVSSLVTDREDPTKVTKGFRFMGQRFIPDSYIFQQLVYDKVGTMQKPRLFPKGLDVAATLGSARAYEILDKTHGETQYANYAQQMTKLRQEFAALPAAQWTENLYWNWLNTLRALGEPRGEGYPAFMRSPAWIDRELTAFLGSWTELRHDTILYAKQSYTIRLTAAQPPTKLLPGYVEPNPTLWARLLGLTTQMRQGLESRGLLNEESRGKLQQMERLLSALKTIAEKELAGQAISEEEANTLRGIGATLEAITTFTAKTAEKVTSEADARVALVADVHTDPNSGQVLQVGVGDVWTIYVLTPAGNETVIAQGGVFSYYEFTQPMSERLTDEKWQAMNPKPAPPAWTR